MADPDPPGAAPDPSSGPADAARAEVAATARMVVRAGLAEAFGHVSARHRDGVVITSVRPLAGCRPGDTVVVDPHGDPLAGPGDELPLETPMHLAVYRARSDVAAICRGHPPAAVAWGTATRPLPLLHGLGLLAGRRVRVHPDVQLATDAGAAEAVAATLGPDSAVLLRANGGLAVGATLPEAAVRLWFVEERARVALGAETGDGPVPVVEWDARSRHSPAELRRAIRWFLAAHADERPLP